MAEILGIVFAWGACLAMVCFLCYERGQRKGFEEAERLMLPVLDLAKRWAEIHLAAEKAAPPQRDMKGEG